MSDFNYSERKNKELRERSSSARNIKVHRDIKNDQYFGNNSRFDNHQLSSKQSKQYPRADWSEHKGNSKNGQNAEYIKSLYKKYLGKQNQNRSQRKQRMEAGVVRNIFGKENKVPQLNAKPIAESIVVMGSIRTQGSQCKYQEEDNPPLQYSNSKYSIAKGKQILSIELPSSMKKHPSKEKDQNSFYFRMLNESVLECMGESRSSMVCCLKNICKAKQIVNIRR